MTLSTFVPKAFTPFQWAEQLSGKKAEERLSLVRRKARGRGINLRLHNPFQSEIEGVISRGGREVSELIFKVWQKGATLQAWRDKFNYGVWEEAAREVGLDFSLYLRKKEEESIFPWDFIDIGVKKEFLLKEWRASLEGKETPDCRVSCASCGVCQGQVRIREAQCID